MEAIFRSLLQKQGYKHICLLDSDKQIWGYAKDGLFHFCKSDLSVVDRKEIGITEDIAVLSIKDGSITLTKDEDYFSSCIILDKDNKILNTLPPSNPFYIFKRLNNNSIVVTKPIWLGGGGYRRLNDCGIEAFYPAANEKSHIHEFDDRIINALKDKGAYICLDGVLESKLFPYMYYNGCCFFLSKEGMKVYHPQKGIIYNKSSDEREYSDMYDDHIYPPHVLIWSVKNRGVFIVESNNEDKESANIVTITPLNGSRPICLNVDDITKRGHDEQHENSHKYLTSIYGAMCSEDYLILPFCGEEGLFIIHIKDEGVSAKCLYENSYNRKYTFQNGIIESVYSYEDGYYRDGEFYTRTIYEYEYYDADCYPLHVVAQNYSYLIYKKSVSSHNGITKQYGVLKKDDFQTILPPIYNAISFNDDYTFSIELKNEVNGKEQILKGLFSVEDGFILPIGVEFHHPEYRNNITGISINTAEAYYFNIFSFGEHEGLLFGSKKVLEPIYDCIDGFSFREKFDDDNSCFFDNQEAERKTKEYEPLSVILYKDGKAGLFIVKEHIIEPVFDHIECCKVLKGHAYFEAQQGKKKRIISDDIVFIEKYQELYDKIFIEDYGKIVYFYVYKDGKVGMISTNTNYYIPIQYEELQVFNKCYIGDGYFYTRNGQKLFCSDDYELDAEEDYLVFKNVHTAEYVFVSRSGGMLKSENINNDIIYVKGNGDYILAKYSTKDKCFIKEED